MTVRILTGDALTVLRDLPDESVQCCVCSPPYWGLRDYGHAGQLGLERTPEEYVANMVAVFREVRRVLRDDATLWINLGDSYTGSGKGGDPDNGKQATNKGSQTVGRLYATGGTAREAAVTNISRRACAEAGLAPKNLVGIPWRVAFALQADGWYLRSDIIWAKPSPMPESVTDRPTKSHEYVFLLSKRPQYYYDAAAIAEPAIHAGSVVVNNNGKNAQMEEYGQTPGGFLREGGVTVAATRNRRTVWTIASQPFMGAHFATMPVGLVEPCILAGSSTRACTTCGAPWMRDVRRIAAVAHGAGAIGTGAGRNDGGRSDFLGARTETVAWAPSCECTQNAEAEHGRCVVLDPFGGAGTTGLVADRLGRDAILIELNPRYAQMAKDRINGDAPLFAAVEDPSA